MMPLATNEVGDKRLAQLSKKIDRAKFEIGVPMPKHPFESKEKGMVEDSDGYLAEQHESLETLKQIYWVP